MKLLQFLNNSVLWGIPMIILMAGCGFYLTICTRGILFTRFPIVLRHTGKTLFQKHTATGKGKISPFQAVSTALAATVGTGNIVGVAVAIQAGGPGAVFWMWIAALLGMVTKYAEVTLSVTWRKKNKYGEIVGGPMYYISNGLGKKWLAILFCIFGFASSFGIGNMVQANSLAGGLQAGLGIPPWITGLIVAFLAMLVLIGGVRRISSITEILVPFMALFYILGAVIVLFINRHFIFNAVSLIINSAFSSTAAVGGFAGASASRAIRIGVARGIFTNEAGLGSAPIAHAAADTDHPARQGLWGTFEVFFDTLIMCTVTALVVLTSGLWKTAPSMDGNTLSHMAFENAIPGGGYIVTFGIALFAFATIIAWYYYGEKCIEFLAGQIGTEIYRILFILAIFVGSVSGLSFVWELADLLNGLMAIPNLITLIILAPTVRRLTDDFFKNPDRLRPKTDTFSHFLH